MFTDPDASRKLAIADLKLIPQVVAIDPALMLRLPPAVTAAGGREALTHALESHIGRGGTPFNRRKAIAALRRIAVWLPHANHQRDDPEALLQMALPAALLWSKPVSIDHSLHRPGLWSWAEPTRPHHRWRSGSSPGSRSSTNSWASLHSGDSRLSGASTAGPGPLQSPDAALARQRGILSCVRSAGQLRQRGELGEAMTRSR